MDTNLRSNGNGNINLRKDVILNNLNLILEDGEVCEVRLLHVGEGNNRVNMNGYYDDIKKLSDVIARKMDLAKMISITVQKLNPDIIGRRTNRIERMQSGDGVSDVDVIGTRFLILDFDPVRPSGLSSNDDEHQKAIQKAIKVQEFTDYFAWPKPFLCDSGNGAHLIYRIDLNREDDLLLTNVITKISDLFSDDSVIIDKNFAKPTQLLKVYGTQAKKGDPSEDRPHRYSEILDFPKEFEIVNKEMLQELCKEVDEAEDEVEFLADSAEKTAAQKISEFILRYVPGAKEVTGKPGYQLWSVDCPNHPKEHKGKAYIYFFDNGAIGMKCHSDRCADFHLTWDQIVERFAPEDFNLNSLLRETNSFDDSDKGNAERLIRRFGDVIRFVYEKRMWLHYDGQVWVQNRDGRIERFAKDTIQSIANEEGKRDAWVPNRKKSWLSKCLTPGKISSMLRYASTEERIAIVPEVLDRDPWKLNILNGTIDLKSGKLLPHRPEDFHSKIARVKYDPSAKCPRWTDKFMMKIFDGDLDLIEYVQKVVGYSLTGSVSEQCVFFFMGGGQNGKSTFLNVIRMLKGDYCSQAAPNILLRKQYDEHPTAIADLAGYRVVITSEPDKNKPIAEGTLKSLTGNDAIKARFMHENYFEFIPTFKIFFMANHLPAVNDTSYGFWRRMKLIPFNVQIDKLERIPDYENVLAEELPGILNWAIEGCLKWQNEGLDEPELVQKYTAAYKDESDVIEEFISECCTRDLRAEVSSKDIYTAYREWCEFTGNTYYNQKRFGASLKEHGFNNIKRGNMFWHL